MPVFKTHHFPLPSLKTPNKLVSQDIENHVETDMKTSLLLASLRSVKSGYAGCCRRKVISGIVLCQFPHATVLACQVRRAHWHNSSTKAMKITIRFGLDLRPAPKGGSHACYSKAELKLRTLRPWREAGASAVLLNCCAIRDGLLNVYFCPLTHAALNLGKRCFFCSGQKLVQRLTTSP